MAQYAEVRWNIYDILDRFDVTEEQAAAWGHARGRRRPAVLTT
jgi:hypothetical protein